MKYRSLGITAVLLIVSIFHFIGMTSDGINRNVEYITLAAIVALSALFIFQVIRLITEKKKQL